MELKKGLGIESALPQRNGCQSTPLEIYQGETVQGIRYKDCQNGADVALYTITRVDTPGRAEKPCRA